MMVTIMMEIPVTHNDDAGCGDDDGDAAALHVCGAPGIGKTSGVLGCCRKAISDVSIADEDDLTPVLIHVNAGHLASGADPTRQLLDTMSESLGMRACKNKASIEKHLKNKRKLALVVLDEIDMLVSGGKTQVAAELLGTEAVVQTLLDWSNGTANVALIAISNSTGNDKFARLHSIGKVSFYDTHFKEFCLQLAVTLSHNNALLKFTVQRNCYFQTIW